MTDKKETINSVLQKASSVNTMPDKVTLWHFSSDQQALKSFLDTGAQPIGIGQGAQTNGFFVWNNKEGAVSHFKDFLYPNQAADGLLIGVNVHKKDISYPTWQFDIEVGKALNSLLSKYKDDICRMHDLTYRDDKGAQKTITQIRPGIGREDVCVFQFKEQTGRLFSLAIGNDNGLNGVNVYQAIVDRLCQNPAFKQEYDALLWDNIKNAKRLAAKYCGKDPLPVDEVTYIHKDENNIDKEQSLYTSSVTKEKQVCPFLIKGLAKLKNARD